HTRLHGDWSSDVCSSDLRYGVRNSNASERGVRRRRVVDYRRQLERRLERKVQKLLETEIRDFAIALSLNHDGLLVCIRHLGTERSEERRVGKEARAGGDG